MKENLFYGTLLLAGFLVQSAAFSQNAIQIHYGIKNPVGNNISKAFNSNGGESVSFLHQISHSKWSAGVTLNRQKFLSNDSYFNDAYKADMSIYNTMVSVRKKMFLAESHHWYFGADLGVAFTRFSNSTPNADVKRNTNLAKGVVLGTVYKLNQQLAIDVIGGYHVSHTNEIRYHDKFNADKFKYASVNFGIRYQFINKKDAANASLQ
jgi:opacity protein-like surface antigen